jgi:hypothetical protein
VNNEAVQKELGLKEDQVAKVRDLGEQVRDEMRAAMQAGGGFGDFRDLSPEERQKRMTEFQARMAETTKKINDKFLPLLSEILTEEQETRLQQIAWQAAGVMALLDAELQGKLGLSKEQQDKLAALNKEAGDKLAELRPQGRGPGGPGGAGGPGGPGGNFQELFTKMREINETRDKNMLEVLTADQKAKFDQAKGKEFDVAQLRPRFGGPGGPGGPGGSGGPGAAPGGAPGQGRPRRPQQQ